MHDEGTILVVEDQRTEREALVRLLQTEAYSVVAAKDSREALKFRDESIDLVLCDLRLGKASGVDVLREWRRSHGDTPFIIMSAFSDIPSAVSAIKLGAEDYMTKPVDPDTLLDVVKRLVRDRDATDLEPMPILPGAFGRLRGRSPIMEEVFGRARRAAPTNCTVLILGESGTGKELLAEAIHAHSRRANDHFVAINMAALPETLVESALFGHARGAFTGAESDRKGTFEAAHGGTLFVDEIGDLAVSAQVKLLRAIEVRKFVPLGTNCERTVDARVIAATSRDLASLVERGEFRRDLFYRLNVVTITLPPLRERSEDVPLLVDQFLDEVCAAAGRPRLTMDALLLEFLSAYSWPGNIRQLRNAIESMVVMTDRAVLSIDDLPAEIRDEQVFADKDANNVMSPLQDAEQRTILAAIKRHAGNRTHAAAALGISVRTLQRKLKGWNLPAAV